MNDAEMHDAPARPRLKRPLSSDGVGSSRNSGVKSGDSGQKPLAAADTTEAGAAQRYFVTGAVQHYTVTGAVQHYTVRRFGAGRRL